DPENFVLLGELDDNPAAYLAMRCAARSRRVLHAGRERGTTLPFSSRSTSARNEVIAQFPISAAVCPHPDPPPPAGEGGFRPVPSPAGGGRVGWGYVKPRLCAQ